MFDILVFIGRFQPFHNEHKNVIDRALEEAKHVVVLVGSAGSPRTVRNPFTYEERYKFITEAYPWGYSNAPAGFMNKLIVRPLFDNLYNDTAWERQVQSLVNNVALDIVNKGEFNLHGMKNMKIGLIGASKDHTSYYLKKFPQWDSIDVPLDFRLDSTDIRNQYWWSVFPGTRIKPIVPENVYDFMFDDFIHSKHYEYIYEEFKVINAYKESWKDAPYPVKQVTVDAVIEQSGHILLVKRKASPGKGLIALPGGHLEIKERIVNGMIRELREETGLKVPEAVLRGSIKNVEVFDEIERSNLGRVITHAFHIELADQMELPKVKGGDDAEKAFWCPISQIEEHTMFDDHFHIIKYFTGI